MKKFLAMIMTLIVIMNISIGAFAAEPVHAISRGKNGDLNYIKVEYTEGDNEVTTVIGGGYRFTNVINSNNETTQLFISEYNEEFVISENARAIPTGYSLEDIINTDRTIGAVDSTEEVEYVSNVEPRAGIIHRTSLDAIRSFMRHYSDGKYELQYIGSYHSTYSRHPNVNTYSYRFADAIDSINDCMWDVYFSLFGNMQYVSTVLQFVTVVQTLVEDGNRGELLIQLVNTGVQAIPEVVSSGFLAVISMATNLALLGISAGDAKLFYNYVVQYSV